MYGKPTYLGMYDTPEEAGEVYHQAKKQYLQEIIDMKVLDPRIKKTLQEVVGGM